VEKMKIIEKLKGQVTIFGRAIPAALAAVLAIAILSGLGFALLTAYVTITGTAQVKQSVILNDFETSWKYLNEETSPVWGDTWAKWKTTKVVGGDEQDVGFKLSNYAEIPARIKIIETVSYTGDYGVNYTKCTDVIKELYAGYTPSNDPTCIGPECAATENISKCGTQDPCMKCVRVGDTCKGDEKCTGANMTESFICSNDVWTSDTITLPKRTQGPETTPPGPVVPSETWYCIRYKWHIAAVPGTYGFTTTIVPA
jgi:hypothetical protein